jgi:hypothetical protein
MARATKTIWPALLTLQAWASKFASALTTAAPDITGW